MADTDNHTIREVKPIGTNWVVTTLVGRAGVPGVVDGTNGTARLREPKGLAVDSAGIVFWPRNRPQWLHLGVCGTLIHAGYLGGVWAAVKAGLGAGTVALVVGLQPVLTAVWVSFNGGRDSHVSRRQWTGLLLGFSGLLLVVWRKLGGEITPANLGLALFALVAITVGTLYQKRFVAPTDVRTANFVQILCALAVTLPLAAFEQEALVPHVQLVAALAWSVFGLTLGGSSLLYMLIQRGAATKVTSLLYLVPPCTAAMAWLLFGEPITATMVGGMGLIAAGVALVVR